MQLMTAQEFLGTFIAVHESRKHVMVSDVNELVDHVYNGLCGEDGLLTQLRAGRGLNKELHSSLVQAIEELTVIFSESQLVPRKLAAAFVDICGDAAAVLGRYADSSDHDAIEDALYEIADLGRNLFDCGFS